MLTVITFEELQKLYRDRKIDKSESFDFLSEKTQKVIGDTYKELNEERLANLIYVKSVDGEPVLNVKEDILEDANDSFMAYLPLVDGKQVCLIVKDLDKELLITDTILDEIESADIGSEEEEDFFKLLLLDEEAKEDSCVYAVSGTLSFDDVLAVLYPKDIEEKVNELKEANKERDVLFKTTSLFS